MIQVAVKLTRQINVIAVLKGSQIGSACDPVEVRDQDGGLVELVPCGDIYNVIVFSGIRDIGPPYSNSIIDQP